MTDTSQYGEATAIVEHFSGRIGRFLDVGAYGVNLSNTWPLAQLGWSGVCVEPSPMPFTGLMAAYEGNDRVELVNAALIGGISRLVKFHCTADALSSTEDSHVRKFSGYPFRKIFIPAGIDWEQLLTAVDDDFDFVSIDTEGTCGELLRTMPMRPEMICVEYDPDADGVNTVHNILTGWGYRIRVIGGNVMGVRS